jgi:hypothetical protein
MEKAFKPVVKEFLGMEVRIVGVDGNEYIILKDMFDVLNRLDDNGDIPTSTNNKVNEFLQGIGKSSDRKKITVDFGKKKGKGNKSNGSIQTPWCLKLETVPVLLTQFKPSNSKKRTQEENERIMNEWFEFMKFVNELLVESESYKYIIFDKGYQNKFHDKINELVPSNYPDNPYRVANAHIAKVVGVMVCGAEIPIWKGEITSLSLSDGTVIEMLKLREEIQNVYISAYEMDLDFNIAYEKTKEVMLRRYKLTN